MTYSMGCRCSVIRRPALHGAPTRRPRARTRRKAACDGWAAVLMHRPTVAGRRPMPDPARWLDREALAAHISARMDELPRMLKAGKLPEEQIGAVLGALVAIGDLMFHLSANGDRRVMETLGMAYLRGAIRGEDGPVNADGSEYRGVPADA